MGYKSGLGMSIFRKYAPVYLLKFGSIMIPMQRSDHPYC